MASIKMYMKNKIISRETGIVVHFFLMSSSHRSRDFRTTALGNGLQTRRNLALQRQKDRRGEKTLYVFEEPSKFACII